MLFIVDIYLYDMYLDMHIDIHMTLHPQGGSEWEFQKSSFLGIQIEGPTAFFVGDIFKIQYNSHICTCIFIYLLFR